MERREPDLQRRVVRLGWEIYLKDFRLVSLNLQEKLFPPDEPLEGLEGDALIEAVKSWFLSNFEDPVHNTPYSGREGGYQYIWGGPYDAREEIEGYFGSSLTQEVIDRVVEDLEADALDWAPNDRRIYDEEESLDDESGSDTDYARLQRALTGLDEVLNQVDAVSASIGDNRPPEDIGVPPYTDEDKTEIKAAIAVLRQPETVLLLGEKAKVHEAAAKIKSRADKLGEFLAKHGDRAADAFSTQLGKAAATVVVGGVTLAATAIWPHLHAKLLDVYHAVQALLLGSS
jgi:hypothetical protein